MQTAETNRITVGERGQTPPRIIPNQRQLDRQHPDLSFAIDTGGRQFFRVLLTNDPVLFDPARASQRNDQNFYDSIREGLILFDGRHSHYLVPRAVLRALQPARAIYFTVVAYESRDVECPSFALSPRELPTSAPSIAIMPDFRIEPLGLLLGMSVDRMQRLSYGEEPVGRAPRGMAFGDPLLSYNEDDSLSARGAEADALSDDEMGEDVERGLAACEGDEVEGEEPYALADGLETEETEEGTEEPFLAEAAGLDAETEEGEISGLALEPSEYDDGFGPLAGGYAEDEEEPGEDREPLPRAQSYMEDGGEELGEDRDDDVHAQAYQGDDPYELAQARGQASDPQMLYDEEADAETPYAQGDPDSEANTDVDAVEIAGGAHGAAQAFADAGAGELYEDYSTSGVTAAALDAVPTVDFDIQARKAILQRIMPFESGEAGFARIEADGEYLGRYGTEHPAYRKYHLGLTWGAFPFVQERGSLGQLLVLMRERDPPQFAEVFGPHADELIAVTSASGPASSSAPDGLSPRLAKVEEAYLWQEPWLSRFRRAASVSRFQGAQNELAARLYIEPVLVFAKRLGLTSPRALTLVVDRAVQMGVTAAKRWIVDVASPLQTPAQEQQALAQLGISNLSEFQRSVGLPVVGTFDADTEAALVEMLRIRGCSPVPLPTTDQAVMALVRRSQGTPWEQRVGRLSEQSYLDIHYRL